MAQLRPQHPADETPVPGARILVIEARFHEAVADELLAGARARLEQAQAEVTHVQVPGALEIPIAAAISLEAAANSDNPFDGLVALGCVIRGETSHYDIVAGESARALMELAMDYCLPFGNGILTVDTEAQAFARARRSEMDKGGAAASAALALVRLTRAQAG